MRPDIRYSDEEDNVVSDCIECVEFLE